MCETDYSGYPDCRDDTVKAAQATLNLGMATRLVIHTPLMWTDKTGTWAMAGEFEFGSDALVELSDRVGVSEPCPGMELELLMTDNVVNPCRGSDRPRDPYRQSRIVEADPAETGDQSPRCVREPGVHPDAWRAAGPG